MRQDSREMLWGFLGALLGILGWGAAIYLWF
jgi:hypothetical protein